MLTKDRVGAALAVVAAIVGLVLVFSTHKPATGKDDDDNPGTPTTSQVQTAAPTPASGVAPTQAPTPTTKKDDDDD